MRGVMEHFNYCQSYSSFDYANLTKYKSTYEISRAEMVTSTDLRAGEIDRKHRKICRARHRSSFFQRNAVVRSASLEVWFNNTTVLWQLLAGFLLNVGRLFLLLITLQCRLQHSRHTPRRRYIFCPTLFLCLSVCLLARLLKNACMDLDEMLRVDRCRDMDKLINFWARSGS